MGRFGDGARLWLDDAVIDTGHGIARGSCDCFRPGELPLMDLSASVGLRRDADLALSADRAAEAKVDGLAGCGFPRRPRGRGSVRQTGPTRGFPYREGQGSFRAEAAPQELTLFYAPGWPEIRGSTLNSASTGPRCTRSRTADDGRHDDRAGRGQQCGLSRCDPGADRDGGGDAGRAIRLLQDSPLAPSLGAGLKDLTAPDR